MNKTIQQFDLTTAVNWCRHCYASVQQTGGARLVGMNLIPAHRVFNRLNSLATISGEPMT